MPFIKQCTIQVAFFVFFLYTWLIWQMPSSRMKMKSHRISLLRHYFVFKYGWWAWCSACVCGCYLYYTLRDYTPVCNNIPTIQYLYMVKDYEWAWHCSCRACCCNEWAMHERALRTDALTVRWVEEQFAYVIISTRSVCFADIRHLQYAYERELPRFTLTHYCYSSFADFIDTTSMHPVDVDRNKQPHYNWSY